MTRAYSELNRVEIDLAALGRNYLKLADAALPGGCAAVVKANAYGLGIAPVARKLREVGCRHFFVATPREGFELRELLSDETEIFLLDGVAGGVPAELASNRLIPVLNSQADFEAWAGAGPAAVHVDTGMCRLGLAPLDIEALRQAGGTPATDVRYVLTHLACADEPEHTLNRRQLAAFDEARTLWPKARTSIGNSAAALLGQEFGSDLARAGIAIYGGNPFRKAGPATEPVISVKARVLQLREVRAGSSIGYGATFVAESDMRVATIAYGYADGYPRSLSNCGVIAIAGRRVPIVGRVSMDLVCADVSALDPHDVAVGGWATMIGGEIPIDEVATYAGTISYELLTSLGSRLERVYLDEPAQRMEQLA